MHMCVCAYNVRVNISPIITALALRAEAIGEPRKGRAFEDAHFWIDLLFSGELDIQFNPNEPGLDVDTCHHIYDHWFSEPAKDLLHENCTDDILRLKDERDDLSKKVLDLQDEIAIVRQNNDRQRELLLEARDIIRETIPFIDEHIVGVESGMATEILPIAPNGQRPSEYMRLQLGEEMPGVMTVGIRYRASTAHEWSTVTAFVPRAEVRAWLDSTEPQEPVRLPLPRPSEAHPGVTHGLPGEIWSRWIPENCTCHYGVEQGQRTPLFLRSVDSLDCPVHHPVAEEDPEIDPDVLEARLDEAFQEPANTPQPPQDRFDPVIEGVRHIREAQTVLSASRARLATLRDEMDREREAVDAAVKELEAAHNRFKVLIKQEFSL